MKDGYRVTHAFDDPESYKQSALLFNKVIYLHTFHFSLQSWLLPGDELHALTVLGAQTARQRDYRQPAHLRTLLGRLHDQLYQYVEI